MIAKIYKNPYIRFILFGVLAAMVPTLADWGVIRFGTITTLTQVIYFGIAALGLNLLLGYSGSISLGTAGFMGLGAYIAAYVLSDLNMSFLLGILIAILVPTAIGILVGLVSLRISGLYLAIATLCVSEILLESFRQATDITGGMSGKRTSFPSIFGYTFDRASTFIFLVAVLVLVMILTYNLVNSHLGRAFNAMRGSEVAAQAMGVNLLKYRLIAFALATAYAGLAGALCAYYIRAVSPTQWSLNLSLLCLAAVVIGGFRSIYGTVLGAFVVWAVPDLFLKRLPIIGDNPAIPFIFNGVLIIVVIMFYPHGLVHITHDARKLLNKLKKRGKGDADA
ncbi:MAG: branched-chain amino acid ABC transporter permease [Defluviitaleaceae bacterium]|nr:branched-chain amino acid ABC transporter permease [Defluviitaleaceae bacterium]MCL2836719.1 branched-chain amino acid ABC transporter permease [Defluviitaleaceae bacterium]